VAPYHTIPYTPNTLPPHGTRVVAKCLNAMMGLKQSGRVWHGHFRRSLLEMAFTQCEPAPCLYTIAHTDGVILV
jgi:hypothetical protein